jgi:filamentous hemagglutinin family protein
MRLLALLSLIVLSQVALSLPANAADVCHKPSYFLDAFKQKPETAGVKFHVLNRKQQALILNHVNGIPEGVVIAGMLTAPGLDTALVMFTKNGCVAGRVVLNADTRAAVELLGLKNKA